MLCIAMARITINVNHSFSECKCTNGCRSLHYVWKYAAVTCALEVVILAPEAVASTACGSFPHVIFVFHQCHGALDRVGLAHNQLKLSLSLPRL